jgi:hypothetical protein
MLLRWISIGLLTTSTACIIDTSGSDDDGTGSGADDDATSAAGSDDAADDATSAGSASADSADETAGPEPANSRCDAFCEAFVGLQCDNGLTMPGCLLTCQSLTSSAVCDASAHAYFDCVDGATLSCNGAGDPVAEGCGLLYLDAIGCAVTENPNPDMVEPCATYCDGIAEAACEFNGTVDECNTNCLWLGNTGTGCDGPWGDFLTCANAAEISCLLGFAVAEGCGDAFAAYGECINTAGGG